MKRKQLVFIGLMFVIAISGCVQQSGNDQTNNVRSSTVTDDKSLTIEKSTYTKGELVDARFRFNTDLYVHPYFTISRFENNDWVYLGMWTFDGNEYICCGAIPSCEKLNTTQVPMELKWDQKIAEREGDKPILPNEEITKKQVDTGKYKISVVYGDRPVCIDSIEAEFLIK